MGMVIPFQRSDWSDLLQLKFLRNNSATEWHLKYFAEMYNQKKQEYVANSY